MGDSLSEMHYDINCLKSEYENEVEPYLKSVLKDNDLEKVGLFFRAEEQVYKNPKIILFRFYTLSGMWMSVPFNFSNYKDDQVLDALIILIKSIDK